jgi:hypothetical protein
MREKTGSDAFCTRDHQETGRSAYRDGCAELGSRIPCGPRSSLNRGRWSGRRGGVLASAGKQDASGGNRNGLSRSFFHSARQCLGGISSWATFFYVAAHVAAHRSCTGRRKKRVIIILIRAMHLSNHSDSEPCNYGREV